MLALAIHGDRQVRPLAEDPRAELGQHRRGADLHEDARPARPHRLDHLDEADRARDLPGEERAHRVGIRRVGRGLAVGEHVDGRRLHRDPGEVLGEGRRRPGHDLAVERRGDREPLGGDPLARELGLDRLDRGGLAGEDDLGRVVVVGHHHLALEALEEGLHLGEGPRHRGHRPGVLDAAFMSWPRLRAVATRSLVLKASAAASAVSSPRL